MVLFYVVLYNLILDTEYHCVSFCCLSDKWIIFEAVLLNSPGDLLWLDKFVWILDKPIVYPSRKIEL